MKSFGTCNDVNLNDRITNNKLLAITGQPQIEKIMRRNRLRWFVHASLVEKVCFHIIQT